VRKNGSGYYLVLHPLHPAAGRPDFVPWVLGKQQTTLGNRPAPVRAGASQGVSVHQASQMGTLADKAFSPQSVLNALANLGLPDPAGEADKPAGTSQPWAAIKPSDSDNVSFKCPTCHPPLVELPYYCCTGSHASVERSMMYGRLGVWLVHTGQLQLHKW
jgi:hypothetical protein